MCTVSFFESEELVKRLKPLDLTQAGKRSWIDQVTVMRLIYPIPLGSEILENVLYLDKDILQNTSLKMLFIYQKYP